MSSRDYILASIRENTKEKEPYPEFNFETLNFDDKVEAFVRIGKALGSNVILLEEGQDVNEIIKSLYPDAKSYISNLPNITIADFNPDDKEKPADLNGIDVSIVQGKYGVCENGGVYVDQDVIHRTAYFITKYLVLLLDKEKLFSNMQEAFANIPVDRDSEYSCLIAGPSKTADIEQSLVVGAHGPMGATVILY